VDLLGKAGGWVIGYIGLILAFGSGEFGLDLERVNIDIRYMC
jgi:hypothetical protein